MHYIVAMDTVINDPSILCVGMMCTDLNWYLDIFLLFIGQSN